MSDFYYNMGSFTIRDHYKLNWTNPFNTDDLGLNEPDYIKHLNNYDPKLKNTNYDPDGIYHRKDDEIQFNHTIITENHPLVKNFLKKFGLKSLEGVSLKRLEQYVSVFNKNQVAFTHASKEDFFLLFDKIDRQATLIGVDFVQTPLFKELTKLNPQWGCYLYLHIAEKEMVGNEVARLSTALKESPFCLNNNADYEEKIKQLTDVVPRNKIRLLLDQVNAEIDSKHFSKGTPIDLRNINNCLVNAEFLAKNGKILEEFSEKIKELRHRSYVEAVASYIRFMREDLISVDVDLVDKHFNELMNVINSEGASQTFSKKAIGEIKNEAEKIRKQTYRELIKILLSTIWEFSRRGEINAVLEMIPKAEKVAQSGRVSDSIKKEDMIALKHLVYEEAVKRILTEAKLKASWGLVGEDIKIIPDASTLIKEAQQIGEKGGIWQKFKQEAATMEQNGFRKKIEVLLKSAEHYCEKKGDFFGLSSLRKAADWASKRKLTAEFKDHLVTVQLKCNE